MPLFAPQFDATGFPNATVPLCVLPSDAEMAARSDTRGYLYAMTTNDRSDVVKAAYLNPASPYNPLTSCPMLPGATLACDPCMHPAHATALTPMTLFKRTRRNVRECQHSDSICNGSSISPSFQPLLGTVEAHNTLSAC